MTITHQTVIGEDGHPEDAIIPWSVSLEIQSPMDDGYRLRVGVYRATLQPRGDGSPVDESF